MKRPFFLGNLPEFIEGKIYYHLLRPVPGKYDSLYKNAQLKYAKSIYMEVPHSRDYMYDCIALMGYFEPNLTRRMIRVGKHGGLMVDVGANVGYFSLIWLAARHRNTCIAIEPSPLVLSYLVSNIRSNKFESRCEIKPVAAGSRSGTCSFDVVSREPTGWGRLAKNRDAESTMTVDVELIEHMIRDDQEVDFLKIDVEGSEAFVLEGCRSLLERRKVRNVYLEQNKPGSSILGIDEDYSLEILRKSGFKMERMTKPSPKGIDHWWGYIV